MARPPSVFVYRSEVPASASSVFRWHERPDAVRQLIPSTTFVRLERHEGSLANGSVRLSIGLGPFRMRWETRLFGYVRDSRLRAFARRHAIVASQVTLR